MKTQFEQNELERMRNDSGNYKWGFFYFCSNDPRCLVPRKTGIGLSPNFANPYSYLIIIIISAILIGNIDKIIN
jgi:uncharacterized membrane protein